MTKNGFNIQAIVKEAVDKFSPVQDDVVNNTSTLDAAALEAREKFEAEFDEEFKDPANHETLRSMDRRMDELANDIKLLIDSRARDFQNAPGRKDRLPVIPRLKMFENHRITRAQRLEESINVGQPKRPKSFSQTVKEQLETYWNVNREFEQGNLLNILQDFYHEKCNQLLIENNLLLSRWSKFCRTEEDVANLQSHFMHYQSYLQSEYTDSVERYEKIHGVIEANRIVKLNQEAKAEQERKESERRGFAVVSKPKSSPTDHDSNKEIKDSSEKYDFDISDLSVYVRWLITHNKNDKDVSMFLNRVQMSPYADCENWMYDYHFIKKRQQPEQISKDSSSLLLGLEKFISDTPVRQTTMEDYFKKFDRLISHFNINTPIGREDGRALCYEVDTRFNSLFQLQSKDFTFIPYGANFQEKNLLNKMQGGNESDRSSKSARESFWINSKSTQNNLGNIKLTTWTDVIDSNTLSGLKTTKVQRLRKADWVDYVNIHPRIEPWQEQLDLALKERKEFDFETRYEYFLITSDNLELVGQRIKEHAKRIWDQAAEEGNVSSFNKPQSMTQHVLPTDEDDESSMEKKDYLFEKQFDHGILIIDNQDKPINTHILEAKKQHYSALCRKNEEIERIEQELLQTDPARATQIKQQLVHITLATVFGEHEILSYLQLRHLQIREHRSTLLHQLNYFRSIEKRIYYDLKFEKEGLSATIFDPLQKTGPDNLMSASLLANMWKNQSYFEPPELPIGNDEQNMIDYNEDTRVFQNNRLYVKDHQNVSFIYDETLRDLSAVEQEVLKIITVFINKDSGKTAISSKYMEALRFRLADRVVDTMQNTYLNPALDRGQMLLDIYEHEVRFCNAKTQLINIYMEIYENTTDKEYCVKIAQIIADIVHLRPHFDFEERYFSRFYVIQTKALELQSSIIANALKHSIKETRNNITKMFHKSFDMTMGHAEEEQNAANENDRTEIDYKKLQNSPLAAGLPIMSDDSMQKITMHYSGIGLSLTEFIPSAHRIVDMFETARYCINQMQRQLEYLSPKEKTGWIGALECIAWKNMNILWDSFENQDFSEIRATSSKSFFEFDTWFDNPLLVDVVLNELYVPYDQPNDKGTYKELKVAGSRYNMFNDPAFQPKGIDALSGLIKLMTSRRKLHLSWIEGEQWRRVYEQQCSIMSVKKDNVCGRLSTLRFDLPTDVDQLNYDDDDIDYGQNAEEIEDGRFLERRPKGDSLSVYLSLGSPAIFELDNEGIAFKLSDIYDLLESVKPSVIDRIVKALKVQLIEKNFFQSAAVLNCIILADVYAKSMEEEVHIIKNNRFNSQTGDHRASTMYTRRSTVVHRMETNNNSAFATDYKMMIPTILSKKKFVRKCILQEFAKEGKKIKQADGNAHIEAVNSLKDALIDWYCVNLNEIVVEECEKAEFANLVVDMWRNLSRSSSGKMIFRSSPMQKNTDANSEADQVGEEESLHITMVQDLVYGEDILAKLWYIPHINEIIYAKGNVDRGKAPLDMTQKIYKNQMIWSRSISVHSLICDIYSLVQMFAVLVQDSAKYSASVSKLRVAEFVIHIMASIKSDLSHQGAKADFTRVENYLKGKWTLWTLRVKFAVEVTLYNLQVCSMPVAFKSLQNAYIKCENPNIDLIDKQQAFSKPLFTERTPVFVRTSHDTLHELFYGLDESAKVISDAKISEVDGILQEFKQSQTVSYSDKMEQANKAELDYLNSSLKILRGREELIRLVNGSEVIQNPSQAQQFFTVYKYRVLGESIRLYWRQTQGTRGVDPSFLMRTDTIQNPFRWEIGRLAQIAFDKFQYVALTNEILRSYTSNIVSHTKVYFDLLTDERTGRLFKNKPLIQAPSETGNSMYAAEITEEDYNAKSAILLSFVAELYQSSKSYLKEAQATIAVQASTAAAAALLQDTKGKKPAAAPVVSFASAVHHSINDDKVFVCTKEQLSLAITKLGLQLTRWQTHRVSERESFIDTLFGRLLHLLRNSEKIIEFLGNERKAIEKKYESDVRLHSSTEVWNFLSNVSTIAVELQDLKKQRRTDEKRIRQKVVEEYDEVVKELVHELHKIQDRFNEYRVDTLNEVLGIMSETKKEELRIVVDKMDVPMYMKKSAENAIKQETSLRRLNEENHELKMTLLKMRSMYTVKEQALRSAFSKKINKLTSENKRAEEKLWESYREAEAREGVLKKQLTKLQKLHISTSNSSTNDYNNEERRQANFKASSQQDDDSSSNTNSRIAELEEKLKKYEEVNVKLLVHELNEKTKLLEQVVGEKHSLESHMRDVGLGHLVGNSRPPSPYRRRPHTAAAKFKSRTQQLKKQQVKDISISDLELYSDGHNWTNESSPIRIIPSEEFLESHRLAGRRESELLLEAESRGYNEGQTVDFLAKYRRWSVQFNNAPEVSYDMPSSPGSRRSSGMHHHHYNRQSLASNTPEKPKHGATLQVYEPRPSMKIDREVSQEDQKQQQFETLEKERRYTTRIRPATAMPDSSFSSSRKLMPNSSVLQFALPDVSKSVPTSKSVTRAQSAAIKSRINSISTTSMSTRINSAATTASTAAGHSSLSIIRAQSAATTSMAQSAVSSLRIQSAASHPKSSIGIPNILRLKEQIPSSTK